MSAGTIVVVKVGGEIVARPDTLDALTTQLHRLSLAGCGVVVVHGSKHGCSCRPKKRRANA
jgi:acetylglutamate kinase